MAKSGKLRPALDRLQGRNFKLEKQRKLEKAAGKRKKGKAQEVTEDDEAEGALETEMLENVEDEEQVEVEDGEDDNEDADEEEDIPLSDLSSVASEEKGDLIPHQRLTINNTTALLSALKRIALPTSSLPFSEHQSITTTEPVSIPDIEDDLNRELAFYQQSLNAVKDARTLLKKEGVPFSRPTDYFAEMVKSDEHMGRVKKKLVDAAASKKAAAEARKQRDLKKFGKAVQVEKQRERDRAKRETMEKISSLKRSTCIWNLWLCWIYANDYSAERSGADLTNTNEEDIFDVALEDAATAEKADKAARRQKRDAGGKPNPKRQKRDEKYGFGGKKRHKKSGDAISSADMRDFSTKKMKAPFGGGAKAGAKRPGKSKRAKMR
ncbi:eukaryotic rRNA processing [Rhizodiscina lignyota]|uniref:Eukaryotic rRNA processing n=1 Tax=Rhizodiscina lignyota TaxID=1504668 RepID=A0A9P4IRP3_9PEZI|nr:eukaryotic rRNA processing [Rhizodiscina lignyota]